jgi:DNA-binding beta-propeller fold protein YncE
MSALSAGLAGAFLLAWLMLAPAAQAEHEFCLFGTGAGQCESPTGVAVDEASGNVYVADRGNSRINVFEPDGDFLFAWGFGVANGVTATLQRCGPAAVPPTASCFKGISGSSPGQFGGPWSIAIDNDPTSASYRSVYVGTDNFRVQKFDRQGNLLLVFGSQGGAPGQFRSARNPIAIGPGGTVYVADSPSPETGVLEHRIDSFSPSGALVGSCQVPALVPPLPSQPQPFRALAIDISGDAYVAYGVGFGIFKYDLTGPTCTAIGSFDAGSDVQTRALSAIDAGDDIFAFQEADSLSFVTKYQPDGATILRFGYGEADFLVPGLAGNGGGELFASEEFVGTTEPGVGNKIIHLTVPPAGPLVVSTAASPVGNTKATLNAQVNPEGKAAKYRFEYVDEATYLADVGTSGPGHGFDHAKVKPVPDGAAGSDFELHAVQAVIGCPDPAKESSEPAKGCLSPDTAYRFRVVVTSVDGSDESEGQFTTLPPLRIEATWSSEVGTDSARLNAEVNPLGIPTTGHFEYVDEAGFAASGFATAKGTDEVDFGAGESPVTRGVYLSDLDPGAYRFRLIADDPLVEPVAGPVRAFVTQQVGMSRPPCPNDEFRTGLGAYLPDCRAYEMVSPVDKESGDIVAIGNINSNPAQLNQSAATGDRFTYSSYRSFGDAQSAPFTSQYFATRYPTAEHPEREGWESHGISPARGINILFQGATLDTEFKAFSEDLCAGWLLHDTDPVLAPGAIAGFANLYRRGNCDPLADTYAAITTVKPPTREAKFFAPELQGVSADGSHAVFRADDQLTANANPGKAGTGSNRQCYDASGGKLRLVSLLPGNTVSKLDCSIGTAYDVNDGRSDAVSNAISADGSRIFWTAAGGNGPGQIYVRIDGKNPTVAVSESVSKAAARFWAASATGSKAIFTIDDGAPDGEDLYEFDVDKAEAHQIAGEVEGVAGASEDAARIYFVSREELGAGAAAGEPNLYLYQAGGGPGSFSFIGTLAEADVPVENNVPSPVSPEPSFHTARVSPGGSQLAFMSTASLTGYDNVDADSGEADAEVYLYDVAAGLAGLACISCNPTGARPLGRELLRGADFGTGIWAAAQLPRIESQIYSSRALSEDGTRLFFESYEALLARDTNGRQDVYLWQRAGSRGECEARGAELYVAAAGGCLSLISSGEDPKDSEFVDASANGADVFFATGSSLASHDPGLIDVYDARVGGGFPPPPSPRPPCEGEACQSPPAPPDAPTPASSVFRGPHNPPARKRCAKGKRRVVRQGKVRCVKQKKARKKGAARGKPTAGGAR